MFYMNLYINYIKGSLNYKNNHLHKTNSLCYQNKLNKVNYISYITFLINNIHTHNFCKLTMNYNLCKVVHMEYMNQCLNKIQICNLCKYYLMYKFYMDLYKDYILNLKQQNNNRLYKKYKLLEYYMSSKDVHNFKENIIIL